MEQKDQEFLLENRVKLVNRLNTGPLLAHLEREGILSKRVVASMNTSQNRYNRTEHLLDYLPALGRKAFPAFEKWLKGFQPFLHHEVFGGALPEDCGDCDPETLAEESLLPDSGEVRALVLAVREAACEANRVASKCRELVTELELDGEILTVFADRLLDESCFKSIERLVLGGAALLVVMSHSFLAEPEYVMRAYYFRAVRMERRLNPDGVLPVYTEDREPHFLFQGVRPLHWDKESEESKWEATSLKLYLEAQFPEGKK